MSVQPEFNVPLTPVLTASLKEVKRLDPEDQEALKLLLEILRPMLKKSDTSTEGLHDET